MLLQLTDVAKSFPGAGGDAATPVLRGVSLALDAGESLAVTGPSGSGKTTLLNLVGGLDRPDRGAVRVEGRNLGDLAPGELARWRAATVGFVFQDHHLLPQLTVLENVLLPLLADRRRVPDDAAERGRALLRRVGLAQRLDHRPGQLSGGERQRVALVRALIRRPRLVLADEPTGALDRPNAGQLADLLVELNRDQGVALVVVTHWLELAQRMTRRLELREGRLVPPEAPA